MRETDLRTDIKVLKHSRFLSDGADIHFSEQIYPLSNFHPSKQTRAGSPHPVNPTKELAYRLTNPHHSRPHRLPTLGIPESAAKTLNGRRWRGRGQPTQGAEEEETKIGRELYNPKSALNPASATYPAGTGRIAGEEIGTKGTRAQGKGLTLAARGGVCDWVEGTPLQALPALVSPRAFARRRRRVRCGREGGGRRRAAGIKTLALAPSSAGFLLLGEMGGRGANKTG